MTESNTTDESGIWVLTVAEDADEETDRGAILDRITGRVERTKLSTSQLQSNLGEFLDALEEVVQRIPAALGDFSVDTVALSAEISAKGTVSLVGTGGEIGATGGITI